MAEPVPLRQGRGGHRRACGVLIAAPMLLWPAVLNGYPLVFADTGTYLSQAIDRYLGWDRPPFYSLFMLPLHLTLTTWPVVVAQALLAAWVIGLVARVLAPRLWLPPLAAGLAVLTPLPWTVAELMPDLFTPLMVLALALLIFAPDRLGRPERFGLVGLAAFAMAAHLSNLPLALGLLITLLPLRWMLAGVPPGSLPLAAPAVAALALFSVNMAAHRGVSLAPYGNVFLLARVLYDGPGADALRQGCPDTGWRLCPYAEALPPDADAFLWRADSPLNLAGGAKRVSMEAGAIVAAAVAAEPGREVLAMLANAGRQLALFATGDGLKPWPSEVTPWIARDFPRAELAAYAAARQTRGAPLLPGWMPVLHAIMCLLATALALALLPPALRRRDRLAGFLAAALLALVGNALITGALSGPHARYQSRVMWLPALVAAVGMARTAGRHVQQ